MSKTLKKRTSMKTGIIKSKKNRKENNNKKINKIENNKIWGNFGRVYSPKKNKYLILGSTASFNVIRDELVRDKEWYNRVKYMAKRQNKFGEKLKNLLV
jgi:hypothetical protein